MSIRNPVVNTVKKSGRTTQFTQGVIRKIGVIVDPITYVGIPGNFRFRGQFQVKPIGQSPFTLPGDSGSLVTTSVENQPVGLMFALDTSRNDTWCTPIIRVLNAFKVRIVVPT